MPSVAPQSSAIQTATPTPSLESNSLFGTQPLPPLRSPYAKPSQQQSVYRRPSESNPDPQRTAYQRPPVSKQQAPVYQQPQAPTPASQAPKPFSQFDAIVSPQPMNSNPQNKSKKMRRIIGIAVAVLLLGLIGVGVYSFFNKSGSDDATPTSTTTSNDAVTKRLERAFDKHLQTRFIRQSYEQVADGINTDVLKLDTTSDFTDPSQPKSHIHYDLQAGRGDNTVKGAGEVMILGKNEYFGKLLSPVLFYQGDEAAKPKENQWYKIANDDTTGEMLLDPTSSRAALNSPLGELPVGNFQDTTRQELMQFIAGRTVYAIKSSNEVTDGKEKLTHYNIDFNAGSVSELNKKIADAIEQKDEAMIPTFAENDVKNMEIWVNNNSGQITKVKYNREYSGTEDNATPIKETITVAISYPSDSSSIKTPEGAIAGPWVIKR
ncbi:MAG: hypothetical protein JWM07_288 [Candidatus Saccharibacteria bacterium]|nr:hypothetical protein [Candidatus Saccharibacteria bacterium]